MEFLKAIILGIVQGITEWLPVSSTGHMILVDEFIKLDFSQVFISTFFVVIQFGSILAVLFLYFKKLNPFDPSKTKMQREDTISLWLKVIIAVIPSGIIGLLFDDKIEEIFFNPTTVAIMLIVYGVIFIILESRNKKPKIETFILAFLIILNTSFLLFKFAVNDFIKSKSELKSQTIQFLSYLRVFAIDVINTVFPEPPD